MKYAAPAVPVQITCKRKEQNVIVSVTNGVCREQEKNESTSIGLITCRRIVEYHKGRFTVTEDDDIFRVTLFIPIKE